MWPCLYKVFFFALLWTKTFFSGNYLVNFQPASKGSFIFSSVIQFSSVTPSQCAQVCVEQQGTSCYGFYFCHQSTACYLTSMGSQSNTAPGESKVVVDKSFQASICTFYTRKLLMCTFKKQVNTTDHRLTLKAPPIICSRRHFQI